MTALNTLTSAEQRVGNLLSQGLSNKAIAQHLVLSIRTVECHISKALAKTGCTSRLQLAVLLLTDAQQATEP
ncbi:response regulator transcription factor [Parasynechococcus sp.]|jgi:DNA-binding NarL/FixJ family response regulator|uniref:response regulator transcription factor n=1 Tax=Parasynechococcus sp. TaxID=3101203 RepID=UPI003704205D